MVSRSWLLIGGFVLVGCGQEQPAPRVVAAREQAECRYLAPTAEQVVVDYRLVDRVEPSIAHVHSLMVGGPEARVIGAKLHIRPILGVTTATLGSVLLCHEARALLAGGPTIGDDPYSLPDEWVDIRVEPDGPGYLVMTEGKNPTIGLALLARANQFAQQGPTRPTPVEPPSEVEQ